MELTAFQDGPFSLDLFICFIAVVTATSTKPVNQCVNLYYNVLGEQIHCQPLCMALIYLRLCTAQSPTPKDVQQAVRMLRLDSLLARLLAAG